MPSFFTRHIGTFATATFVAFISDRYVSPSLVLGRSMFPTLNRSGSDSLFPDIITVDRLHKFDVQTGDIVCFRSPVDPSKILVKRILASEGEWVSVDLGGIPASFMIPEGKIWVEGDNSNHSIDSRRFGAIPLGLVLGRATRVIWPPQSISKLERDMSYVDRVRIRPPSAFLNSVSNTPSDVVETCVTNIESADSLPPLELVDDSPTFYNVSSVEISKVPFETKQKTDSSDKFPSRSFQETIDFESKLEDKLYNQTLGLDLKRKREAEISDILRQAEQHIHQKLSSPDEN